MTVTDGAYQQVDAPKTVSTTFRTGSDPFRSLMRFALGSAF